ncbi:MAG: endopeptidase La [Spirochaetes bacterium]|nr:endopeptidase La [Spirochaetota bacterium]
MLPLRDLVLFPHTVVPIFITTKQGVAAVEYAQRRDNRLFAVCVKKNEMGMFGDDEPYEVGTVVRLVQHLRLPDNTYRVVLQGEYRGQIYSAERRGDFSQVEIAPLQITGLSDPLDSDDAALMRSVQKSFAQYAEYSKKINTETLSAADRTENPERLANLICNATNLKSDKKIELLGIADTRERLLAVIETLEMENEIFSIQKNISGKVKSRMDKTQREYILHEQLKEINKELGKDKVEDEFAIVEKNISEKLPPEEIMAKARKEIARLRKLQPLSPEAGVLRGYLEWISDLPWVSYSVDCGDLGDAKKILNADHFGMRRPKERILEFIAVRQLLAQGELADELTGELVSDDGWDISGDGEQNTGKIAVKGPILCFVGPPGTGKTSLGKSVARALGRRFVRISLGGVRDEAEIRGHRKTYVGALPGKIIQSMRKAGTVNPVFLLDEIDKLSSDFRGDPASALLEVLDPEQNATFTDHYMEVPYDLSKVLFITTANSLHTIPYPLLDRMEIIEVAGYGENEKLAIAKQFLVPKELRDNGLSIARLVFKDDTLRDIIRYWTNESGVRSLEREIARCIRRIARRAVHKGYGRDKPVESFVKVVRPGHLEKLLGRKKYKKDVVFKEARVGVTYGLAWTQTGGTTLPVETIRYEGGGDMVITGNLGDVMKESARIALSYLRSCHSLYNFETKDISKSVFHIHVPEGAIPKDGPSAGITLASSMLSTLCKVPPKAGIAMTGELTLTGRVLPVGGLKEKLLAAIRNGMERAILPKSNEPDWSELDKDIRGDIQVEFAENAQEVFAILFGDSVLKKPKGADAKRQGKNSASVAEDPAGASAETSGETNQDSSTADVYATL